MMKKLIMILALTGLVVPTTFAVQEQPKDQKQETKKKAKKKKKETGKKEEAKTP